ncbi:MAG: L,D-transpeptidase family protein [Candidatus Eisenbacteria bacterium]
MKSTRLPALLFLAFAIGGCSTGPASPEVAREIATLGASPQVGGEQLFERAAVERFYKTRASKPAWLEHADDVVGAIRGTEADGLDPSSYHLAAIEALIAKRKSSHAAKDDAALDMLLCDAVANVADDIRFGRVLPSEVNPEWTADPRDDAGPLDSTLAVIASSGSVRQAIDSQRPGHFIYKGLLNTLEGLRRIEQAGGWQTVSGGRDIRPGAVEARVAQVRRRLLIGGDAEGDAPPDSTRYDASLASAVQKFKARHRLGDDATINRATIDAMNVSTQDRIAQVRVNLERARWVLGGLPDDFMLVNLPAFKAYLIRGNQKVWESRTQIGQEAMQTPTFRANIRTVVFNPTWTVPPTILEKEILVDMRSGNDVLTKQGLVIYDARNQVVEPGSINWNEASPASFPYTIRQPAGDDNALGEVKFLFPNKYSIYLHDTPHRNLFDTGKRTFSHGCIRLENPLELAKILLQGQGWDTGRIDEAIVGDTTRDVALEHPLPIMIVYWTVSVGAAGEVRYADDIYHLDAPLLAALDRQGVVRKA